MEFNAEIHKANSKLAQLYNKPKKKEDELNVVDLKNAEDILLIAIELQYETKLYDWSILNPINFNMISMLEFGCKYFPESEKIANWLIKLYVKLGMVSNA